MSGSNLTRVDADTRAKLITVHDYDIALDLTTAIGETADERTLRSRTEVTFSCAEPGSETFIDLIAHQLHEVTLNGEPVAVTDYDPKQGIRVPNLAQENTLIVDADCLFMTTGEGMHRFVDPVDNEVYLYTQFEARDACRVYACFDQPNLKARFNFHVTAPSQWKVFSSSALEKTENENSTTIFHFAQTALLPTYITAIVAGPYQGVEDTHDGIPLGIYCRKSMRDFLDAEEQLTITKQGFDFFHQQFDYRYPFDKYDQIFVAEFNAGAMENAGCVVHSDDYMLFRSKQTQLRYETRATTILHEMAHMWFGNLVTMNWWDDLWLNESFAEWASQWAAVRATKYTNAWTTFATTRKAWGIRQDQLSSTHPVAADAPDVDAAESNFDGITYAKGASILKQLVAYVGEDTFLTALRGYFKAHAFGNATLNDLLGALEKASGRDMKAWAQAWLTTANVNTLRPVTNVDDNEIYQSVAIEQTAPADYPTLRPHRIALGSYEPSVTGNIVRDKRFELDIENGAANTPIPQLSKVTRPALLLVNDDDLTFAKIRLDEHSMSTVVESIHKVADPLARNLCWGAAWDMNRDAELATRHYVQMAINGLPSEQTLGVVQGQLNFVLAALDRYANPEWAPTGYAQLADVAWQAAGAAEPGSDLQLVWVRTLANSARTPESLDLLRKLLEADASVLAKVPQLKLDADLRWLLLQSLVAQGAADEPDIAAEAQQDQTDQGARFAAMARAMIPSAQAKAKAWELAVENKKTPNQTALAIMRGFSRTEHAHLLQDYIEKYFDVLPGLWETRTTKEVTNVADWLYPSWEVSQDIVDRSNTYVDSKPDLPSPLRRSILEGRDALTRALKARACDAAAG